MYTWLISDTHTCHDQLQVPPNIEMVVHCGDEANTHKSKRNLEESKRFFDWFQSLAIPNKVFVPGNHSVAIEHGLLDPSAYPDVRFLIHQSIEIEGIKIFGSPYTPWFFNWAYNIVREELNAYWSQIPTGLDLLITHGPPKGFLDVTRDMRSGKPIHVGSLSLTKQVTGRIKPKVHAFGHIHDEDGIQNFGQVTKDGVRFINCSCCNLHGQLVHNGVVLHLENQPSSNDSNAN